jgi:hypothetical protein
MRGGWHLTNVTSRRDAAMLLTYRPELTQYHRFDILLPLYMKKPPSLITINISLPSTKIFVSPGS